MNESMALLLSESLDPAKRELTHQHIESCADCEKEWNAMRETWRVMGDLPEVVPPPALRARFLEQIQPARPVDNVVPFYKRPATRWVAQAAAIAIMVGGGFFAGRGTFNGPANTNTEIASRPITSQPDAKLVGVQEYQPAAFSLAESRVVNAASMNPVIQGRPHIQNVNFTDSDPTDDKIGVAFDITSRVTVTGSPRDESVKRLLSYVIESDESATPTSSDAIEIVRKTYSDPAYADPQIANALAKVLRNEEHEGARIRAVDSLKTMPASVSSATTQQALIDALKNDPNPAVRIKAVETLAQLAQNGKVLDANTLDTLRAKTFDDEVMYVRVKAAEALSNVKP
jgi:hypothetical protein